MGNKKVSTSWIFDLDGVVTHLEEKRITNPRLLYYFAMFLQKEEPVTINTGRSLAFIREKVLTPLLSYMEEKSIPEFFLHNFFAVGEKGNAWIEDEKDCFDTSTAVPEKLSKKTQALIEKDFSDTMIFDTTKHTMISTEMKTGLKISEYAPYQKKLIPILKEMLGEEGLEKDFRLDPTVTAVDIEHISAGKAKGTERILRWLTKRSIEPNTFVAFGDSAADLGTGEELQKQGKNFNFVFVGDPEIIKTQPSFPITYTKERYDKGVVEWLESM